MENPMLHGRCAKINSVADAVRTVEMGNAAWSLVRGVFFFFQAEDGIRDLTVTGVQTCALPISTGHGLSASSFRLSSMSWGCAWERGAGSGEQCVPVPNVAPLTDEQLAANFADIAPPLTNDAALLEANQCLFCHDAPCTIACPTHIDVPAFIKKIASGNLRGSARVILDANPFGHSCARACPVEVLCEGACVLNARDEEPIKIALLQRHATDYVLEKKLKLFGPGAATGKRVAIVGAGPAGLSCARDLRVMGPAVT